MHTLNLSASIMLRTLTRNFNMRIFIPIVPYVSTSPLLLVLNRSSLGLSPNSIPTLMALSLTSQDHTDLALV